MENFYLNSNLGNLIKTKDTALIENLSVPGKATLSFSFDIGLIDMSGYTRIAWFPYVTGQNYMQFSINYVGGTWYATVSNEYSGELKVNLMIYSAYIKNN